MSIEDVLNQRSDRRCELCKSDNELSVFEIPPVSEANSDKSILVCLNCLSQITNQQPMENNHWRCLNDSMWSQVPAVQVMAWRLLKKLSNGDSPEIWAGDLLDMLYLDDGILAWAEADSSDENEQEPTKDCNGAILEAGDTVTLIKDLDVKGGGFTAKRGTAVRNISLTTNPEQIEGRVNGTRIVLLTCYLKKST